MKESGYELFLARNYAAIVIKRRREKMTGEMGEVKKAIQDLDLIVLSRLSGGACNNMAEKVALEELRLALTKASNGLANR